MKGRVLAWSLWLAFVVMLVAAAIYGFNPPSGDPIRLIDAVWAFSFIGFPTTGALIASRMPDRPLGWIFCVAPLVIITAVLLSDIANRADLEGNLDQWLAWTSNILFSAGLSLLLLIPLLLPKGSPDSRFDRLLARVMLACGGMWIVSAAFAPGSLMEIEGFTNPIGIQSLEGIFDFTTSAAPALMLSGFFAAIVSLGVRYRRSGGQARLQLKWVALAAGSIPIVFGMQFLIERFVDLGDVLVTLMFVFVLLAIPASIGVAMLRYRLYEIDQIINRTVVYVLVTGLLVGAYVALVVALQLLLDPVTKDSDLAVAASTLAVAALFRPVRNQMQALIDRRFYRRKYDAARTLTRFGTRLRDEVDLEVLQSDVIGVLNETVQPAHVGLWLRAGATR